MKDLRTTIKESLSSITEARVSKWTDDNDVNVILTSAIGSKLSWRENTTSKQLNAIGNTFKEWYASHKGKELHWYANDDSFDNIEKVNIDSGIFDISFGECQWEDTGYREFMGIYTTYSFWGVQFEELVIVAAVKPLSNLQKEVKASKEKANKEREQKMEYYKKQSYNSAIQEYESDYLSDSEDLPEYKQYSKYKGKFVLAKVSWTGLDEEFEFYGIFGSLYNKIFDPNLIAPVTTSFKTFKQDYSDIDKINPFHRSSTASGLWHYDNNYKLNIIDINIITDKKIKEKYIKAVDKIIMREGTPQIYKILYQKELLGIEPKKI